MYGFRSIRNDSAPEPIRAPAVRFYRAVGRDVRARMAEYDGEFRTNSHSEPPPNDIQGESFRRYA
jgi:hypothetical protein